MAKTVLIVDDVAYVRRTLARILTGAHYQVVGEAETGVQAVRMYKQHSPDVVTMDIVMPEMSGIEATRQIVRFDKDAKVVIVSAMGQEHLVMEAIHAGAKDYITKPFQPDHILRAIQHVLFGSEGVHEGPVALKR